MMREPIANPKRRETLMVANGNTSDIIKSLMTVADMDYQAAQVEQFAQRFKGSTPDDQYQKLKELWRYTRKEIQYEEDPSGVQLIKDPGRVYWDNQKGDGTDCKSLSLFEYSVCRAIGIQCYFEFVSFFEWFEDPKKRITHVYPVAIVPGIGEVVLDAVHSKFDERPPGITRTVKKYTKAFKKMAEIYHIAGTSKARPTLESLASEAKDRAALVQPLAFVDTIGMTQGEMLLFLKAQRDKILAEYYQGTPLEAEYRRAFEQKRDTLYNGLHRSPFSLSFGLGRSKAPASGFFGSMAAKGIDIKAGIDLLFDDASPESVRGIGAIEQLLCDVLYPLVSQQEFTGPPNVYQTYVQNQTNLREACKKENDWRKIFNDNLPKSAHHPLYNFATSTDKAVPTVATKAVLHSNSIGTLSSLSKINLTLLKEWQYNGVLSQNIAKGAGPVSPQDAILAIKQAEEEKIGVLPIAAVVAIIGAVASAIAAASQMIAVLKSKQPTAAQTFETNTQGWGTQTWGPEKQDWIYIDPDTGQQVPPPTGGGLADFASNQNLPLILLGLGGAALLLGGGRKR